VGMAWWKRGKRWVGVVEVEVGKVLFYARAAFVPPPLRASQPTTGRAAQG